MKRKNHFVIIYLKKAFCYTIIVYFNFCNFLMRNSKNHVFRIEFH